jgi:hypothetical protein
MGLVVTRLGNTSTLLVTAVKRRVLINLIVHTPEADLRGSSFDGMGILNRPSWFLLQLVLGLERPVGFAQQVPRAGRHGVVVRGR